MELVEEIQSLTKQLEISIKALRKNGTAYAQAEKDYKLLLRTEILKLRDEGMAVGVLEKICYGIPAVADLRFKRDVSRTVYEANLEAINAIKLRLRLTENQLAREWSASGEGDL